MAASSLLALIDDIATVLDDIAVMSKVAAKKTAGVLGDDLALNAEQVSGIRAERELPVVWAVAMGSLKNKAILVPAALAISAWAPWMITPLLMVGGAFLCFEGFEKLVHPWLHAAEASAHKGEIAEALKNPHLDMVAFEQDKIQGAIRTDFVLSAEIIAITLGVVQNSPFTQQVSVLVAMALAMTVGVYGFVAAIVKMDDVGLHFARRTGTSLLDALLRRLGAGLVSAAAPLMKLLSVVGMAAMFMVGGGIVVHGIPGSHDVLHATEHAVAHVAGVGPWLAPLASTLVEAAGGVVVGALVVGAVTVWQRLRGRH